MKDSNQQRYRGILAYDGTRYTGFQRQKDPIPTVQATFEHALEQVMHTPIKIYAAGRTDAGVHARGQVIAFDGSWQHPIADLERAINAHLPSDLVLRQLEPAQLCFHPRYDAVWRQYVYQIYTAPQPDPIWNRLSWYVGTHVDVDAMQSAADLLIGIHDFAAFGHPTAGTSTVRNMYAIYHRSYRVGHYEFVFEANAFLKRMIRRLMGNLVKIGRGKMSIAEFEAIFAAQDRRYGGASAPPHGLCLEEVQYEWEDTTDHETQNLDPQSSGN